MLFEEADNRLTSARAKKPSQPGFVQDVHRVRAIYSELISALDVEAAPELATQLLPLYQWCVSELGASAREPDRLAGVQRVTRTLSDAWFAAVRKIQ